MAERKLNSFGHFLFCFGHSNQYAKSSHFKDKNIFYFYLTSEINENKSSS
jgi:hypothetical protein